MVTGDQPLGPGHVASAVLLWLLSNRFLGSATASTAAEATVQGTMDRTRQMLSGEKKVFQLCFGEFCHNRGEQGRCNFEARPRPKTDLVA